jgi:hypothetical protein
MTKPVQLDLIGNSEVTTLEDFFRKLVEDRGIPVDLDEKAWPAIDHWPNPSSFSGGTQWSFAAPQGQASQDALAADVSNAVDQTNQVNALQSDAFAVATDKDDYAPGSTATFTATNLASGDAVTFTVEHVDVGADKILGTDDDRVLHDGISGTDAPWTVVDGSAGDLDGEVNGTVVTTWSVGLDAADQAFLLTALEIYIGADGIFGNGNDVVVATATANFTDADELGDHDLRAAGSSTTIGGAIFQDSANIGSGTGGYNTFLAVQDNNDAGSAEAAFNSDDDSPIEPSNPEQDLSKSHTVRLSDIPIKVIGGIEYYEFRVDLNESNSNPNGQISLDQFIIKVAPTTTTILTKDQFDAAITVYNMDAGGDRTLLLSEVSTGSGTDDYSVLVPVSNFAIYPPTTTNMYLYVQMGAREGDYGTDGGFEEWNLQNAGILTGLKFSDIVGDGARDVDGVNNFLGDADDEVGVSGVTIFIDNNFDLIADATDNNGILDPGERWTVTDANGNYTFYGVPVNPKVQGQTIIWQVDEQTPTGATQTTDDFETAIIPAVGATVIVDPIGNHYPVPSIDIVKTTRDMAAPAGTAGDANVIHTGEAIQWIFAVTNNGETVLTNVQVSDSDVGDIDANINTVLVKTGGDQDADFEPGETWTYTLAGVATTGVYANTGTATGDFGTTTVTDTDNSGYSGANAQISIVKTTQDLGAAGTGDDGTPDDGDSIHAGEAIQWIFTVTSTGNVALSNIQILDSDLGDIDANVNTVLTKTGNQDNFLEAGETWVYKLAGVAVSGAYENTGTASGSYTDTAGHTKTDTETDTSSYTGVIAQIEIDKRTLDGEVTAGNVATEFSNASDVETILVGETVTWIYKVTNAGDVALSSVDVTDSIIGAAPNYLTGDTGSDEVLSVGETWYFTATGTASADGYENTGTATGSYTDTAGHVKTDTETDPSGYFGADAQIGIVKTTQDLGDPGDLTDETDDGTPNDGDSIHAGEAIQWIFTVTNEGNVDLENVVVSDSDLGIIFDAGLIDPDGNSLVVTFTGDDDDDVLEVGETWVFTVAGTAWADGLYENTGTAYGEFADDAGHTASDEATDDSSYFGADAQINIDKTTQDTTNPDGDALDDAGNILVGHGILWTYTVTNTGNVALADVTVTDDNGTVDDSDAGNGDETLDDTVFVYADLVSGDANDNELLDTGETWVFEKTGTAGTGTYSNTATAEGSYTDTAEHTETVDAEDTSSYFGADASIAIDKTTQDTTDPDGDVLDDAGNILVGHGILWTYTVTNTGNVALADVTVTDDNGTVDDSNAGNGDETLDDTVFVYADLVSGDANDNELLDTGETWVFEKTGTAGTGTYSNTATAEGSYTDTAEHTETVDAEDTSSYFGADAQINIEKRTFDGIATAGTLAADYAAATDGATILFGNDITWIYAVTNEGNVELSNVVVTDDAGTPLDTSDDLTPTAVLDGAFNIGDLDGDNNIDVGETWYYMQQGTAVAGQYDNIGTASGDFEDTAGHTVSDEATDPSSYFGEVPEVCLDGLSHGFWKTHTREWNETGESPYLSYDSYEDTFEIPDHGSWSQPGKGGSSYDDVTLGNALALKGGGENALAREAVAALLNASNPEDLIGDGYAFEAGEVIEAVKWVYGYDADLDGDGTDEDNDATDGEYNATLGGQLHTTLEHWNTIHDEEEYVKGEGYCIPGNEVTSLNALLVALNTDWAAPTT